MAERFDGPKRLDDYSISEEYVKWLEDRIQSLEKEVTSVKKRCSSLRIQLSNHEENDNRRYHYDSDHVPYGDDEYER